VESKEISALQKQRDEQMLSYDKTITRMARDKSRLSPEKLILEQVAVGNDLRMMTKKNQDTKNLMEYRAS